MNIIWRRKTALMLTAVLVMAAIFTIVPGRKAAAMDRYLSEEKDAEDYTPASDAVTGGYWETLQSGERIYCSQDGTQYTGTWVLDTGVYYYVDHTGCLMRGNYSEEGFWVLDNGQWDQTHERLREIVAPLDGRVYGTDPCWSFRYENNNDVWTVYVTKTYSFGAEETYIMFPIGRSIYTLTDMEGRVAAQMSVTPDRGTLLISEGGFTGWYPIQGELSGADTGSEDAGAGTAQDTAAQDPAVQGNGATADGAASAGYRLDTDPSFFTAEPVITSSQAAEEEYSAFLEGSGFQVVSDVVNISSDQYDGSVLAGGITLTLALPEEAKSPDARLDQYMIAYFNTETGQTEYLTPDYINTAEGTMVLTLPHLSKYGAIKLEDEKQIDVFLADYSTRQAVSESYQSRAASELEPYLDAKLSALNLSERMKKELIMAVVSDLAGGVSYTSSDGDETDELGNLKDMTMELYKASQGESSQEAFEQHMENLMLLELKKVLKIHDDAYDENVSGALSKLIEYGGAAGTIAGALSEGDVEGAMQEASTLMQNAIPFGSTIKSAVGYVGSLVNEDFTNWKANEIESLYQVYKNGKGGLLGSPSVTAGNEEEFLEYLNYSGLFQNANGIMRFYRMDKIEETCKKYGWSFSSYEEMDQHYRDIFEQRAEEGLLNYFRARKMQEERAAQIRQEEEDSVRDMLGENGALRSSNYKKFFGEHSGDGKDAYNITKRLERLMKTKQILSRFVDEEALRSQLGQGDASITYGFLLNTWVHLHTYYRHDEAEKRFCVSLEEFGLLNPFYKDFAAEGRQLIEQEQQAEEAAQSETAQAETAPAESIQPETAAAVVPEENSSDDTSSDSAGKWVRSSFEVLEGEYSVSDAYEDSFSASELVHTQTNKYIGPEYEGEPQHQTTVFQKTCSPLPEEIRPGDTVTVRLEASMISTTNTDWNFFMQSAISIHLDSPEMEGQRPTGNGEYLTCECEEDIRNYQVAIDVNGDQSAYPSADFSTQISESSAGRSLAFRFWDWNGGNTTIWYYTWVPVY